VTLPLTDSACVRAGGFPAPIGDLHRGMRAVVFDQVADDGTQTTRVVRAGTPRSFSVDRGQVSSVDGGDIRMRRPDGAQVSTGVHQDTRFRGVRSRGQPVGRNAIVVSEHVADALIAKTVLAMREVWGADSVRHTVRTLPLVERERPHAELLQGLATDDLPDRLLDPVAELVGVDLRHERELHAHQLPVAHGSNVAPSSALAHAQSRSAGSVGIAAKSSARSFSLFSANTRTTSSFVTGGTPSTPTS